MQKQVLESGDAVTQRYHYIAAIHPMGHIFICTQSYGSVISSYD